MQDKDGGDAVDWYERRSELEQVVGSFAKGWQAAVAAIAEAVKRDFSWSESLQHYVSEGKAPQAPPASPSPLLVPKRSVVAAQH